MNFKRMAVGIIFMLFAWQQATAQSVSPINQTTGDYTLGQFDECLTTCSEGGFYSAWNDPCPSCYVQVGALFLQREPRFANQAIVIDPTTNTTFLSTSDLGFDVDPGMQVTIGKRLCSGRTIEFDYFGLFEGTASQTLVNPGGGTSLAFPTDGAPLNVFDDMDRVEVDYTSSIQGVAVNLIHCCGCTDSCNTCDCCNSCDPCGCGEIRTHSLSWFGGFRYISVREELDIRAERTEIGGIESGAYDIQTSNDLFGAQLGARLRRTRGKFGWDATGFAGIFANNSRQNQSATDFPDFAVRPRVSSSSTEAAFVGGINLSGHYVLTNAWSLRAGYNVLWVEGVALAPDQLDFAFAAADGGSNLDNDGSIFLHGANVGLEARW